LKRSDLYKLLDPSQPALYHCSLCRTTLFKRALSRLVEALGPDVLFEIPVVFRGERNALPFRKLISSQAAMLPGFVSEVAHAAPLLHPAFRVEGSREREFLVGLRAVVREILLEPRTSATSKCNEDTNTAGTPRMTGEWEERRENWSQQSSDARSAYDVDYARIIHSGSFRRLQGKTQILNLGDSDFYRTRLTHSLEECLDRGEGGLEVLRHPPVPTDPREQPLDHPSAGLDRDADLPSRPAHDLDPDRACRGDTLLGVVAIRLVDRSGTRRPGRTRE
jgi:hypothetical protein